MKHDHKILSGGQWIILILAIISITLLTIKLKFTLWANILLGVHVYFLLTSLYKIYLSYHGLKAINGKIEWTFPNHLPVYSIIVPLYKEANMIPKIIKNLSDLKYPKEKLQILITLEEDDKETIEAFKNSIKPAFFQLVIVPDGFPKTKPRACNWALRYVNGDHVTIYDAEDRPEPWQLIKARSIFERLPREYACLQAGLNYFNHEENLLTRMFAIEYTHWFWFLVPGLSRLQLPMPLGGTSNHFRTSVIKELGGWNPYNVTEDAELGIRLVSKGYKTLYLPSHTMEEAVKSPVAWIKQRTRWTKGYMHTWLSYSRSGTNLYKSNGFNAGFVMSLFVLGTPLCALLTIPLYLIFFSWLLFDPDWVRSLFLRDFYWQISWTCLFLGNIVSILSAFIAVGKVGGGKLRFFSILLPAYWVLHSVAAWRALVQLMTDPYKWEKTEHGVTKREDK